MTATLSAPPVVLAAPAPPRTRPRWERPSLATLLGLTGLLYLWNLADSGWANAFYSAAVQAGSKSWSAMFFGSSDSSSFITVDKPPASLWIMDLSARIFGVNAWSILVPQALEGVASVAILHAAVRRWSGPAAGLIAGATLALTPVAALMFRFNNPDALLVLLLTASAWTLLRAVEDGRTRWLVWTSVLVGTGFLTKMMQAYLVVPVFAAVYLWAGKPALGRRVRQLLIAGVVLVVSSGWWVAIVELVPASDRPYVGGSQDNSVLGLILGYNGFGRLTGNETGSVGGSGGTTGQWGATGWSRLFNSEFGGQISWLIPSALILLGVSLWLVRKAPRIDVGRAALLVWGGWLVVTGLTLSYASGIIHPYYTVALAPAIGALVGIGSGLLWRKRADIVARAGLAAATVGAGAWAYVLLDRTPTWHPALRIGVLVVSMVAAFGMLGLDQLVRKVALAVAGIGLVAALAAPAAYALDTATTAHSGAIPSAGPTVSGGFVGGGRPTGGGGGFGGGQGGGGGIGNLLDATTPSAELTAALKADASSYTWVVATVGSNSAAGYQLASGEPVMAIGGFNGTDPTPTLAAFEAYAKAGRIHWFIAGGTGSSSGVSSEITQWVEANYVSTTIGGTTVYDLSS